MADRIWRAAVLGHPIAHSLSPTLHRAAYASLGLEWDYQAIDVTEHQLADFVATRDASWAGLSLTMPLKQAVLPLLDERTQIVEITGAANTLVFKYAADGERVRLVGENTDVRGIVDALVEPGGGAFIDGRAVVLGAGATAASALAALSQFGVTQVDVVARDTSRTAATTAAAVRLGVAVSYESFDQATRLLSEAAVVISTLPSGAADVLVAGAPATVAGAASGGEQLPQVRVRAGARLLDVAYAVRPTKMGSAWQEAGGIYVSGERMLLHQAVGQVALFTGRTPDVGAMDRALAAAL